MTEDNSPAKALADRTRVILNEIANPLTEAAGKALVAKIDALEAVGDVRELVDLLVA